MSNKLKEKPEFYRPFMGEGFFPNANKRIKYQESTNYWIFKTGPKVYKIKKNELIQSTISIEQLFCQETVRLLALHSPQLEPELMGIGKKDGAFFIESYGNSANSYDYFSIQMNPVSDAYLLTSHVEKRRLTKAMIEQVCTFLLEFHEKTSVETSKQFRNEEMLTQNLANLYYQSKKYLNKTITQPIIDMTQHPLEKFLNDHKKLFSKRLRKGHIREIHGQFIPKKIQVYKGEVSALGKTQHSVGSRFGDVTSDLADLLVELDFFDYQEMGNLLAQQYIQSVKDQDMEIILPFYQATKCLARGLEYSILMENSTGDLAVKAQETATKYYQQTINLTKQFS